MLAILDGIHEFLLCYWVINATLQVTWDIALDNVL